MSELRRFSIRSSGRDLTLVRRPRPSLARAAVLKLRKDELTALAQERDLDTSGTKAELVDRLTGVESNDADVEPTDG